MFSGFEIFFFGVGYSVYEVSL